MLIVSHQHRWDVTEEAFNVFRWKMLVLLLSRRCSRLSSGDSGFRPYGVFGAGKDELKTEEVSKVEGESVTLHTCVEEYHQISWMLGPEDRNIAKCRGNTDGTRSCEITDERLRDRLKTDNQTGSLSIINISTGLAGLYKLQIISSSNKTLYKKFSVTVSAALPVPMIVKDSEKSSSSQCVLLCSVMNVTESTLCWYKGNSLISSVSVSDLNNSFSRPLEVNYQDFNDYSCVLNNSISSQTTHLNITELCQLWPEPGSDRGYIAQICVPVVLVLVVLGGVAPWICWKKRQAKQNGVVWGYERNRRTVSRRFNSHPDERSSLEIDEES